MNFEIHIKTDNAAFDTRGSGDMLGELHRIISGIAENVRDGHTTGPIYDINGNRVGTYGFYS